VIFPSISVIVPAYNAADTVGETIAAVLAQDYPGKMELIVVDDGSTDATGDVVRSFPSVVYIFQKNRGPAAARNQGAAAGSGDILLFTDSDCWPEPGWLLRMQEGFADSSVGAVAGSYSIANVSSRLARAIHGEIRFRHLRLMPEYPKAFGSYNVAIRAGIFRKTGGFNAAYRQASGEDNDLSYRLQAIGSRVRFMPNACVAHYHQEDLSCYLREQFRHGYWRAKLYVDHSSMAAGDDYTFWKDIVEVPLAAALVTGLFWPPFFFSLFSGFITFEILAGFYMIGFSPDGFYLGLVMAARAFVRSAGFFSGGIFFLIFRRDHSERSRKKLKKNLRGICLMLI
jgi:glycosyltransferase involved in cell wall biosynthesis